MFGSCKRAHGSLQSVCAVSSGQQDGTGRDGYRGTIPSVAILARVRFWSPLEWLRRQGRGGPQQPAWPILATTTMVSSLAAPLSCKVCSSLGLSVLEPGGGGALDHIGSHRRARARRRPCFGIGVHLSSLPSWRIANAGGSRGSRRPPLMHAASTSILGGPPQAWMVLCSASQGVRYCWGSLSCMRTPSRAMT